jgi:5-methylcytosine-specific restriction endonuclease McrA
MPNRTNEQKQRIRRRMYKRQKGLCWICGERMAISQAHAESPNYATFDHLVPKAAGGTRAQTNLKLAHQKCNNRRGDLPIVHTLLSIVQV